MIIRGDAGIGKTTLLAAAAAAATGFRVVAVRGIEGESHLAFAVLADLLEPLAGGFAGLSDAQRTALEGVRSGAGAGNWLAVCAGLLTLLTNAAQREPLLLLVDDAEWIDPASIDVIGFALHRIESDPVVALVALRSHEERVFDPAPFPVLELGGLDGASAAELLGQRAPIQSEVAEACVMSVGGNPLALLELDRTLDTAKRGGHRSLDDPPPVGAALARLVGRRIVSLPAHSSRRTRARRARRAVPGPATRAPRPARPRHPLPSTSRNEWASSTVGGSSSSRTRCCAPRCSTASSPRNAAARTGSLADAFATAGDEDRAAWHLGSAADGPDDVVAAALEAAGARAVARARPPAPSRRSKVQRA